ncbi:hypothetical protein [Arthrobacter mangrovi]|uniref:Uncharacterized protein n=1 Tax=Arthrobacter mangrovi TaxID=2966350 RepID=A0ABQ5MUU8_9MICC|nr:hypothetical protein [Arthrobacter mangrovi]GLB67764.1 hypothetical protein AHIS1636_22040 [Arthrobacter mangrovi]
MSEEPEAAGERSTPNGRDQGEQAQERRSGQDREQETGQAQDAEPEGGGKPAEAAYPGPEPVAFEQEAPELGEAEVASADDPLARPEDITFPDPGVTPGPAEELDRETPDDRGLTTETSSSG